MARPKGQQKLGGRKKGTPNKATAALKDMILNALERAGGEDWLLKLAESEPKAFSSLLAKILPTQVTGDNGGPVELITAITEGRKRVDEQS